MSPGSLIATSQLLCVTSDTFCATSQQAHFITRCELHSPEMQEAILDWSEILFLFFFPLFQRWRTERRKDWEKCPC